tara:strand:+ start:246 stop:803 length:558 start_codon:yes stop_codon:yes gene_type:complete
MYKLYTDKQETFECDLFLEGADLKESTARILVETKDITLLFPGTISKEGNCKVPIKKLKGLLGEDTTGNIKLEVIAEDTLIEPWQSDFVVETSKKVTVEVKSQSSKKPIREISNKPKVVISNVKKDLNPINEIVSVLKNNKITLSKIVKNKKKFANILENYSKKVNYQGGTKKFIKEVIKKLNKV